MPKTSYHFDIGNSSEGPIGLCARVTADSPEQALKLLKAALPEEIEVELVDGDDGHVEYINVYLNDDFISTKDIDEENDPDEDDDSWDGEDEPDEEDDGGS